MDIASQKHKAEAFRKLHERQRGSRMLLLPNAWDAMSARLFQRAGFAAIATTSGGVSWALGYPDGEQVPRDEVIAATARIARVVDGPVTADLEAGFGDTPDAVAETVTQAIRAGVAGINLEDGTHRADAPVRDSGDMAARIRAAREAARAAGVPIVINARTDLYLLRIGGEQERFDEAIRRARIYLDSGADCFFPIGLTDAQTIAALVKALDASVNIALMHDAPPRHGTRTAWRRAREHRDRSGMRGDGTGAAGGRAAVRNGPLRFTGDAVHAPRCPGAFCKGLIHQSSSFI
jgi:2-methylisocitrate lyase-like PEP mutase family enzyme